MILSVALKFRGRNPFVISNDINFQNRAVSLGIPYKEIKDIVPAEVYEAIKAELAKRKSENEIGIKKTTSVKSDYSITDKREVIRLYIRVKEILTKTIEERRMKVKVIDQRIQRLEIGSPQQSKSFLMN